MGRRQSLRQLAPARSASAGAAPAQRPRLLLTNLLNDLDALCALTGERLAAGDLFNAYLLAAGVEQVTVDNLERDRLGLRRAAARLRREGRGAPARVAAAVVGAAAQVLHLAGRLEPGTRRGWAWHRELRRLVDAMADQLVVSEAWEAPHRSAALEAGWRALVADAARLPAGVRRSILRLPTCFRNLDQSPADVRVLTGRFDAAWLFRSSPVVVLGIRTSGSYLAPLHAAFLRRLGWRDVRARTLRPGAPLGRGLARELRAVARQNGLAVLVDDPPSTWSTIAGAARDLGRLGFAPGSLPVLVQVLPSTGPVPPALAAHPVIRLPWPEWEIRRRLRPAAVAGALGEVFGGSTTVTAVGRRAIGRGHAEVLFEVEATGPDGRSVHRVRARGTGAGYLGEHTLAVAGRLGRWVPRIHAFEPGLVFEDAEGVPLPGTLAAADVEEVARYAADRAAALPVPRLHLPYRGAAGEWAAPALAPLFGRAAPAGRLVAAAFASRVMDPTSTGVVDAWSAPLAFSRRLDGGLVKRGYDAGVFTGLDLFTFDPAYDVARVAVLDPAAGPALRRAFERAAGASVDPARWLLLQLVSLVALDGGVEPDAGLAGERLPLAFQRYYGEALLGDIAPPSAGPLCAIDIDGVLETMRLGYPTASPAAVLGLRALTRHGFRPVLATGRSAVEVEERCEAYRLAGGVAEYGAVVVARGRVTILADADADGHLEQLRITLARMPGVTLDGRHRHSVRAYRMVGGHRRGLAPGEVEQALARSRTRDHLGVVAGLRQTDFVPRRVSKEAGLATLQLLLGEALRARPAMAIGDTETDAGMLEMAEAAFAPARSSPALRRAGARFLAARGPAAVGEAAGILLGHQPGGCPLCAPPAPADPLLRLLGIPDRRGPGRAAAMLDCALWPWRAPAGGAQGAPVAAATPPAR